VSERVLLRGGEGGARGAEGRQGEWREGEGREGKRREGEGSRREAGGKEKGRTTAIPNFLGPGHRR